MPTAPRRPQAHRKRQQLQVRRLRAAELFAVGIHPAEVARQLGVSRHAASTWHAAWTAGGTGALQSRGPTGPTPRLSDEELARVEQALLQGATAHGFEGELWTLERIAEVIWRLSGVRHHPAHVWALLRYRMGWTVQRPGRRAAERDQAAVDHWVKVDWPRIKKRPAPQGGHLLLRRVRPEPDPLRALDLGAQRSAAAAGASVQLEEGLDGRRVVLRPRWRRLPACLHLQPGNYDTEVLIGVLGQLRRFLSGQKATLLWDGLPAHRSNKMAAFLASQRDWLVVERLPAYAPELNPVEGLWSNLKGKGGELANLCYPTLAGVIARAQQGIQRVRGTPHLPYSFLRHAGLSVA